MLSSFADNALRRLRGRWLTVLVTFVLAYFGYHALHGDRGLLTLVDRTRDLEAARKELTVLQAERAGLDREVGAFQHDQIDRDLLEEELRELGYVYPGEAVILVPRGTSG